jgi:hypothetical protein
MLLLLLMLELATTQDCRDCMLQVLHSGACSTVCILKKCDVYVVTHLLLLDPANTRYVN